MDRRNVSMDYRLFCCNKNKKRKTVRGEITAFLSMIIFLLLALVGTTLESARVNVGRSYGDRSLQSALDSLFTEYCLPVWEDYHLFLLEGGKTEEEDKEYITEVLQDYMEYTFSPEKDELSLVEKAEESLELDLLDMELKELEVTEIVRAEEYERELLLHGMLEYSKYQVDESVFLEEKQWIETLEEADGCKKIIEKQLEAEQKMAEVNLEVLKFLSAVEGIAVGKNGIQSQRNGLLKTEPYFVKKFCPAPITKENTGVTHEMVWKSLKGSYRNPVVTLESMEEEAAGILAQLQWIEEQAAQKAAESTGEGAGASGLENGIMMVVNYGQIYDRRRELLKDAKGILKKTEQAQKIIKEVKTKQVVFGQQAEELERVYKEQEEKLSESSKKVFLEEIEGLKNFASMEGKQETSMIGAMIKMEDDLEKNRMLLEKLIAFCNCPIGNSSVEVGEYIEKIQEIKTLISGYESKRLEFRYDSLLLQSEVENPVEVFEKAYKNNLLELVAENPEKISKKTKKNQKRQKEGSLLEWEDLKELVNEQVQQILLGIYIEQHFSSYTDNSVGFGDTVIMEQEAEEKEVKGIKIEKKAEKETVLCYEQEYLLSGKLSDKENLEETLHKLLVARGLMNYIYLLTDKEKCDVAYTTALALVGYTCMEPLVRLTKNAILLVWATEEAMADVAALLQGKEIPVMKTKNDFQMEYDELLLLNRNLIQKKANEVLTVTGKSALNYEQYLQIFLKFSAKEVKMTRMAELMEDNICLRYDKEFQLDSCIYGVSVNGEFKLREKFVSLPFVRQLLATGEEGFWIRSQQSYCY